MNHLFRLLLVEPDFTLIAMFLNWVNNIPINQSDLRGTFKVWLKLTFTTRFRCFYCTL